MISKSWPWLALVLICSATVGVGSLAAEPKSADELLDRVSQRFAQAKTWSSQFKQTMSVAGATMVFTGRIGWKQPQLLRMETDMPMMGQNARLLAVIGPDRLSWQEMTIGPRQQFVKVNLATVLSNSLAQGGVEADLLKAIHPARSWELTRQYSDYRLLPPERLDGQAVWVIEGTWKAAALTNALIGARAQSLGRTRLSISQQETVVLKIEQFDKANTTVVSAMEYTNHKFDDDLPDALFQYAPPPGANVLDLTATAARLGAAGLGGPLGLPAGPVPQPPGVTP